MSIRERVEALRAPKKLTKAERKAITDEVIELGDMAQYGDNQHRVRINGKVYRIKQALFYNSIGEVSLSLEVVKK